MALVEFQDSDHELVVSQFEEFAEGTIFARKLWEKCRSYRDGDQYTDEERKVLKARKQPVITDNKIQDKCDTLLGLEKQMRTDPKAQPRNPSDEDQQSAEAATDALRYIADSSDYKLKARKGAADNLMVEGVCYGQVVIEGPERRVCMERIRQDRGYYDIRSLEDDFGDKRYCGYFTWMDEEEVLEELTSKEMSAKDIKEILDTSNEGGWATESAYDDKPRYILTQSKRKRIQVFTHFHLKGGKWMESRWVRGGFLAKPKPSTYKDEKGKPVCPMEIQALYRDADGNPYGVVPRYLDLQDEHNKRRSKMLHLLTAKRVKMRQGVVTDINKLRAEIHKPDGVIEIGGAPEDLVIEDNLKEAEGQWRLLQQTDIALSSTGPNAALAGLSGDISGIAKARDQQAGQLPISPLFDALDSWELRMYRQAWARVRQFWKAETWIRVTDNEESPKWVGLNQPVTRGEQLVEQLKNSPQFQQASDEEKMAAIQQIASSPEAQQQAIKDGKLLKRNVPGEIDVDIIIDRAPDVATLQQEEFGTLAELAKSRPEVQFKTLIKLSGIRQSLKREVLDDLKNMNNPAMVAQQMQQLQVQAEEMQKFQEEMQQKAQELQAKEADLQTEEAQLQAAKAEVSTEIAKLSAAKAEFKAYVAEQSAGLTSDELGFQKTQLEARAAEIDKQLTDVDGEKASTGTAIEQIALVLDEFHQQLAALSQAQQASGEQAQQISEATQRISSPKKVRVIRGPDGLSGELVGDDGVSKRVAIKREADGYSGTVQ